MQISRYQGSSAQWLAENCFTQPFKIKKTLETTRAWFARVEDREVFIKWHPLNLRDSWVRVEVAISEGNLHPAIIPLRATIECRDGILTLYDRIQGENLGGQEGKARFRSLPISERASAVLTVSVALAAICNAGYLIVDWYEGNMIYDFDARKIWLFDWELCREGGFFHLEMASNYGSSRLMAPEEFVKGSRLNQKTIVYNLGRYAILSLPELAEPLAPFIARAANSVPSGRHHSVQEFAISFKETISPSLNRL